MLPAIHTCLWFDDQAEEAAQFYTSIFPRSRIIKVIRYGAGSPRPESLALIVYFELDGRLFSALNGGPEFSHSPAMSLAVHCRDQAEIDRYWQALSAVPAAERCGWLVDRYGVSWQIVPQMLIDAFGGPDNPGRARMMAAMMQMGKLDIAVLQAAQAGQ